MKPEIEMEMEKKRRRASKFMSLVLRHDPARIDLQLDEGGWADVDELIEKSRAAGVQLTRAFVDEIVATSDKQRFAFNEDATRIRANQGHSVDVDLGLEPVEPPELLFHGTATRFLGAIREGGLESRSRQHVHLSRDRDTATKVGARHGKVVILTVEAGRMHVAGHDFYCSANGVWLAERVPVEFIRFPD